MRRRWLLAAGVGVSLAVVGCGGSGPPPHTLSLEVSVPAEGAVVADAHIEVEGTVTPAAATVWVAGRSVHVRGGEFRRGMRLHVGRNRIHVAAEAVGYGETGSEVTVRYRPVHGESAAARDLGFLDGRVNNACATVAGASPISPRLRLYYRVLTVVSNDQALATMFQGIGAPMPYRARYSEFVASIRDIGALVTHLPYGPPPHPPIRQIQAEVNALGAPARTIAHQLGFTPCLQNLSVRG